MTDTDHQAPKKSARPNLFAPQEQTRMADERISVLASLDASPPPRKKSKPGGLARGTVIMLGVTAILLGGVTYLVLTQESPASNVATVSPAIAKPAQPITPSVTVEAPAQPSVSLSTLAASAPSAETSAPATAVIENVPTGNPIAILESANKVPVAASNDKDIAAKNGHDDHGASSNLLKALNAPAANNKATSQPAAKSAPAQAAKPVAVAHATPAPPAVRTGHATKATAVDTDVSLIEALVASSDRQKAREAAEAKSKEKEQEQTKAEKPKASEPEAAAPQAATAAAPPEKTKP